uniref:Lipoprotein n=1 Tax=Panagrellus redivivus TaxID=6233 RepID=A0A7E4W4H8_PANRE
MLSSMATGSRAAIRLEGDHYSHVRVVVAVVHNMMSSDAVRGGPVTGMRVIGADEMSEGPEATGWKQVING